MSILSCIGNTPLLEIDGLYIKAEFMNPTGSIKDRIAYEMIKFERRPIILEASSGNTAISVAFVCSVLGKKCLLFVPAHTSSNKVKMMRAYGAEIDLQASTIAEAQQRAQAVQNGSTTMSYIDQFSNQANLRAQTLMAKEIKQQLGKKTPDAIVCGIGTGGTLAGLYNVFPNATYYTPISIQFHIEGISDGVQLPLKPTGCNLIEWGIHWYELELTKKYLSQQKGLFLGNSSISNFFVANKIKHQYKNVVIISADNGVRYL